MTPSIEETRAALQELPGLAALLPIALTTGPAPQNGTAHPAPASRIPIRLDVIQLLDMRNTRPERMEWADPDGHGVVPYLDGWVVDIADDLEATTPDPHPLPEPQLAAITAWLAERLTLIAGLPQWPDFADGVHRIRHATRQAVAHLANPTPAVIRCQCGTPFQHGDEHTWTCPTCQATRTIHAISLADAAHELAWPKRTLQRWAADRGWPYAYRDGIRVYDRSTIAAAVAAARLGLAARRRETCAPWRE